MMASTVPDPVSDRGYNGTPLWEPLLVWPATSYSTPRWEGSNHFRACPVPYCRYPFGNGFDKKFIKSTPILRGTPKSIRLREREKEIKKERDREREREKGIIWDKGQDIRRHRRCYRWCMFQVATTGYYVTSVRVEPRRKRAMIVIRTQRREKRTTTLLYLCIQLSSLVTTI